MKQSALPPPSIAIINDEPTQLKLLVHLIVKAGMRAIFFPSASAALDALPKERPDLIITDLYMPGLDGWRFCRLLRSEEYACLNQIPILIASATFEGEEARQIVTDLGAEAMLSMPVEESNLIETVRSILSGKELYEGLRVLIVEDEPTVSTILTKYLEANSYTVDVVQDLKQAHLRICEYTYDLALIDYHLQDGRGDSLLPAFRTRQPDCAVIMMTADPNPELALSWMQEGACSYVRKPFEPEYILKLRAQARIERALLRSEDRLEGRTRELRASEERYSLINNSCLDFIYSFDLAGRFTSANRCFCSHLHLEPLQVIGRSPAELGFPDDQCRQWNLLIRQVYDTGRTVSAETSTSTPEGETRTYEVVLNPLHDSYGTIVGIGGSTRDITGRRQAEENYKMLFREMLDGFALHEILTDASGEPVDYRFLAVNPAFEAMTGLMAKDIIGRTVLDAMPGTERHWIETYGRVALTGEPASFENYSAELKKHFSVTAFQPSPRQFACIFVDITHRKDLEERLRQSEKMEAIGQLAGGIAHDFNNQLAGVLGYAEMLENRLDDPKLKRYACIIQTAARRSADLTAQLLAFSRKGKYLSIPISLHKVIAEVVSLLTHSIDKRIEIHQHLDANPDTIMGDPTQIQNSFLNMGINASDAMPDGGILTFATSILELGTDTAEPDLDPGRFLQILVTDTGTGMDAQIMQRIFEPFFTTKEIGKGTGLGLAAVYGAVKNHKGRIRVESTEGRGSTFAICLPLLEPQDAGKSAEVSITMDLGNARIMIVDDEEISREIASDLLSNLGCTVTSCADGVEATARYAASWREIDLVILDMIMPRMNGRDTFLAMQKINPGLKVILASGFSLNHDVRRILDEGAEAFIQKPFTGLQLAAKVREVLVKT